MPCYNPLKGYRSRTLNASGKRSIVFNLREGYVDQPIEVPCGQCIGCRLERSRQWAVRCVHEASLYEKNCFVTLTYSDDKLPSDGSLHFNHFQKFMKRLRRFYADSRIRFFHCGEYGEQYARPHYHCCLFNFDFDDKKIWKKTEVGNVLYTSEKLNSLWGYGYCIIGNVTFESAAYVARYITKKITGKDAEQHYKGRCPEYITMSRRPGIGKGWFDKWKSDTYPSDSIFVRGRLVRPPKFYDACYDIEHPDQMRSIKNRRKDKKVLTYRKGYDLLEISEHIKRAALKSLKRSYENG